MEGGKTREKNLEVENSRIVILEWLSMWDNSMKNLLIQGERRNGSQEPAVAWRCREMVNSS